MAVLELQIDQARFPTLSPARVGGPAERDGWNRAESAKWLNKR